jgi:hypothetical protein
MADVVLFAPRREVDAKENVEAFIALCRNQLTAFGANLVFDDHVWNLSQDIKLKSSDKDINAVFSSMETAKTSKPEPMAQPFQDFAKAYFRYQHGLKPTSSIGSRLAALRALGASLGRSGEPNVWMSDASQFNHASQLLKERFAEGTAYRNGVQLEMVADFLDANRLVAVPLAWKNPIRRPPSATGRVGKEFDERRNEMLPSPFALEALAKAYRAAIEPVDVIVSSVAALLCSSPDRIHEVLILRTDAEVTDRKPDGSLAYGLRWEPGKGAPPMIKWITSTMASVAQEAFQRLRKATEEAREIARWYEAHPDQMYLPEHLEYLRQKPFLTTKEVQQAVFLTGGAGLQFCNTYGVEYEVVNGKAQIDFLSLQAAVIKLLPEGFPIMEFNTGLKFADAICVCRKNEFHADKGTMRCAIERIDDQKISTGLGNSSEHDKTSIFQRLGFFEEDGSFIAIRSHQFRHYLNTIAARGGLNEFEIAKWSGRADISQNAAYNHISDRDTIQQIKDLTADHEKSFDELVTQARVSLIPRKEFAAMRLGAAHTTDLGFCVHDFAMSPCQIHGDCDACNEQVCIKGDEAGEQNARLRFEETEILLKAAEGAESEQLYGATPWVQHQRMLLERLKQLVQILDDSRVPAGAIIRLRPIEQASRMRQALESRKSLGLDDSLDVAPSLLAWQVAESEAPL